MGHGKRMFWLLGLNGLQLYSDFVMVSPGTHLVKNHESLSITSESQFKNTRSPKPKKKNLMVAPLCIQTANLETGAKTLYYSVLKKEITQTGYSTKEIF